MKAHFENSVRKLTGNNSFSLSDRDFEIFLKKTTGMVFEAGTFEQAVAFVAIAVYDKATFISQRARRDTDLPMIAAAFVHAYRNSGEAPMIDLVREKLKDTGFFGEAVILSDEFTSMMKLIVPEVEDSVVH